MRQPSQLKVMLDTDLAWLAGWLEGEGCFTLQDGVRPRVQVGSNDLDVIEHARELTGIGNITQRTKPTVLWMWQVTAWNDAVALMRLVYPHMHARRQARIAEVLAHA